MKLVRYGESGAERPGLIDAEGGLRALGGVIADLTGAELSPDGLARLKALNPRDLPLVERPVRFGCPVAGVGKLVAVGLNYSDHAAEAGMAVPSEPILFMKATSAIVGPDDNVIVPPGSEKTDWEVELAFVIGRTARHVGEDVALSHIAGYTVCNDVSERAYQIERGGQWMKGKCYDSFAPLGPWLVTADEVPDPQALALWLDVNGKAMQRGTTATMVFGVAHLVSYISQFMTLHPGDIVTTGTPPGVGMGMKPQVFLRPGDVITLGVEGLGQQRQDVVGG